MASPSARRGPEPAPEPEELFERLGVHITAGTLERALTHRSFAYEQGGLPTNERLEFLGDSVLGYVVTDHIFTVYPDLAEGDLARRRAAVVSTRALAKVARQIGIGFCFLLAAAGVNIGMISTSEIRISVVVGQDDVARAVAAAHTAFGLDATEQAVVYAGTGR